MESYVPMPFFINLLEVHTFLNDAAVSVEKIHIAVRGPECVNGSS